MEVEDPMSPIMAITPVTPTDNNEPPTSEEQPSKRRRKKSIVWEHFTIETVGAGCMRACCKQCKKSFAYITGSKLAGTSHLKRHIALGICPVSRQKNESSPYTPGSKTDPPKKRFRASPGFSGIPLDQDRCNHEIAKMIILHDYPLHIVEHPGFIDFVRTLQPHYNMVSFNTIQGECVDVYLREKQRLLNLINGIPGRVNLTLDFGISNLDIGYAFLTGHFIDGDWNLQRRILNVATLPFYDSDYAFNQAVVSCLSDWHLRSKLFTLTLDQSFSNENVIGNLRGLLSVKNPFVLHGQLLKGSCYARVLSHLAQDALSATGEIVRRIRESVKYVKTSEAHDEKFTELRQQLQVPSTKILIIDNQTKWNTTYHMLVAASELKEVFACLDTSDPVYKINPSTDDWKKVDILCTYLKLLYDAANILTGPTYPPAHVFYHEVYKIQLELTHATMSQDPFVSNLIKPMKEKFDQYWKDCFLVLAIAVVMDPRFKMKLLEFSFPKVFGEDAGMWIKSVDDGIHELFLDYLAPNIHLPAAYVEEGHISLTQSDTLQEVEVAPAPDGYSQELHPHVPLQVAHPDKSNPQEVPLQDGHHQEVFPQESLPQEVPSQALTPQEMHVEEMPSQEVSIHEIHTEVSSQEPPSQEMHAQDITPQESHTEEAPSQEMQSDDASQVPPQDINTEEVNPQDTHAEEIPSHEVPVQEIHPNEVPSQEVSVQEMQAEEVPAQAMQTEEALPQAMQAEEAPPEEMCPEEAPPEEMCTKEAPPMRTEEALLEEIRTEEAPPQEMQMEEAPPQEMCREEAPPQEMQMEEAPPHEMCREEALPQEMCREEEPPQEMQMEEEPPQEMCREEAPPQETHTEEAPPQETCMEEAPPQETPTEEAPPQEMHTEEVPPQEMQLQVIHQEMQPLELHTQDLPMLSIGDGLSDFDIYISEITSGQHLKSELDQYLEESLLPRVHEFDVVGWWKLNRLKYPMLSKMAADILSIPVSTVAPDSVFDTENRKIDSYRGSLLPITLEALVCAKDWLQHGSSLSSSSQEISNALVKKEF
ncbi:PREDICTED: zinc finger BED domain-containing protein DAYSLEEPER-like isoform X1 [Populus euphratica]|uniref:Zinc finger BED domain-containing protein DAYSLEEPER-like isoform X1 n=1 Tax=Populus euphratica TaxID=75702 RepID=A0AAJ6TBD8_POPEU|nr:PREDICTED: zinc finger BED domain-containing protein DAYSLEEPER-like isoform X1 [Populus euphratica]XP_011007701.1 PREDICTED: zinc finger BED domain-containing protein DAYSLEEPER-like isoform X1 [Populus euphratica]XP_011007702.1 PREDICTED: zinc finger BED domain-containing protein DAYSLEEPER-like isoform X1 [Populus euphratica]XP_011007703.1 PREDICTED: zinc finger BED domain-containing protein DAYSLEEPER-like isoform X1 [Populus euphratica]